MQLTIVHLQVDVEPIHASERRWHRHLANSTLYRPKCLRFSSINVGLMIWVS